MNENRLAYNNRIRYNKGAEKVEGAWNIKIPCYRLIKAPFVYRIVAIEYMSTQNSPLLIERSSSALNKVSGKKNCRTRKGNTFLKSTLAECAHSAIRRKDSYFYAKYAKIDFMLL